MLDHVARVELRRVRTSVEHLCPWSTVDMTFSRRALGVVKIVTVDRPGLEEVWLPVQNERDCVARVIVHNTPFAIVDEFTTTPEGIPPVSVQECHVSVDCTAETHYQAFHDVRVCRLGLDPRRK